MIENFKIRQGLSTDLFDNNGQLKTSVVLESGCWYICTDTASAYICVKELEKLVLKRINGKAFETKFNQIKESLEILNTELSAIKTQKIYQKINSEAELPTDFTAPDFNPNISYYIVLDELNKFASLYIFDKTTQSYMCTNKTDLEILDVNIEQIVDSKLEIALETTIPDKIKETLETKILFGGDANPTDDFLN